MAVHVMVTVGVGVSVGIGTGGSGVAGASARTSMLATSSWYCISLPKAMRSRRRARLLADLTLVLRPTRGVFAGRLAQGATPPSMGTPLCCFAPALKRSGARVTRNAPRPTRYAPIAQMDRASDYESCGAQFFSTPSHSRLQLNIELIRTLYVSECCREL